MAARKAVLLGIGVLVVAVLVLGYRQMQLGSPILVPNGPPAVIKKEIRLPEDGDRPPIIISDGSVDFFVDFSAYYARGEWNSSDDGKTWILTPGVDNSGQPDNRTVDTFAVTVLNVKSGSDACKNPDVPFFAKKFYVHFKGALDIPNGSATVGIVETEGNDKGKVQVVFEGKAERDADLHFWIEKTGAFNKLRAVAFDKDNVCTFGNKHRGMIRIAPVFLFKK